MPALVVCGRGRNPQRTSCPRGSLCGHTMRTEVSMWWARGFDLAGSDQEVSCRSCDLVIEKECPLGCRPWSTMRTEGWAWREDRTSSMICCPCSGGYYCGRVLGSRDPFFTSIVVSTLPGQLHRRRFRSARQLALCGLLHFVDSSCRRPFRPVHVRARQELPNLARGVLDHLASALLCGV